jgi:hypothetical protein
VIVTVTALGVRGAGRCCRRRGLWRASRQVLALPSGRRSELGLRLLHSVLQGVVFFAQLGYEDVQMSVYRELRVVTASVGEVICEQVWPIIDYRVIGCQSGDRLASW